MCEAYPSHPAMFSLLQLPIPVHKMQIQSGARHCWRNLRTDRQDISEAMVGRTPTPPTNLGELAPTSGPHPMKREEETLNHRPLH